MLALGRALMLSPKLLLLDEPTLGLSPNFVEALIYKIMEINKDGTTVLMVEQNIDVALVLFQRSLDKLSENECIVWS